MNSKEPTWTHSGRVNKEGPKPVKFPCLPRLVIAALVLGGLLTGLVIR